MFFRVIKEGKRIFISDQVIETALGEHRVNNITVGDPYEWRDFLIARIHHESFVFYLIVRSTRMSLKNSVITREFR